MSEIHHTNDSFRLLIFYPSIIQEIRKVGEDLGIEPLVIQGEELRRKGFGGVHLVQCSSNIIMALYCCHIILCL